MAVECTASWARLCTQRERGHFGRGKLSVDLRVVYITNIPTPYRVPVTDQLRREVHLSVIYRAATEQDRHWDFDFLRRGDRVIRRAVRCPGFLQDLAVTRALGAAEPDVVVLGGYSWIFLVAIAWSVIHRKSVVIHTDGTVMSESGLSSAHRVIRKLVSRYVRSYVGTGVGSRQLYRDLGAREECIFDSPLAVDSSRTFELRDRDVTRDIDVIVPGRMVPDKNPVLAAEVCIGAAQRLNRRIRVAFVGDGELQGRLRAMCETPYLDAEFPGYLQHDQMPDWYVRSRVLLFPTRHDPWGLVVNEAIAAGAWIMTSRYAGAKELLTCDELGKVLPLEADAWIDNLVDFLSSGISQPDLELARSALKDHTIRAAADGLLGAITKAHFEGPWRVLSRREC